LPLSERNDNPASFSQSSFFATEPRQAIEKQLNKVEGSNKFSKAVSFGHSQEFIQSEKEDQEIAEACRRLIKNSIVCWNYLYLSRQLASEKNEERRAQLLEAIRHGSAATWAHFNLHGEFDFSDERMVDSIGGLLGIRAKICHFSMAPRCGGHA